MSLSVDDYVNAVPEKERYMLDMVVDFKEKYRDGSLKEDHLIELSEVMDCWDGEVARSLELGPPTQAAIRRENSSFEDQKLATLRKWRECWKEEATYRNLIKCFLKAKKTSWAAYVRDMFRDPDAGPPDSAPSRGHVEVLPSSGTTVLGEDHFSEVLDLLWSARSNYTNLGYALGLPVGTMSAIPQSNFYNVDRCFEAVLREVLIRGVTQEELACGLESKTLNYGQLAVIVRNHKFKTSSAASSKSPQRPSNPEPLRPTPPRSSKDVVSRVRHPPPQASDPSMNDCDSPSDSVDFSESMGVDDLAKWLLQKFGRDYIKDIDKLKSASVNGRAFLKLPSKPDLMKKIGLSFVFEDNISDEIKLLHPSPKPDPDKRKCSSSTSSDGECEQDNLVCNILQNRSDQSSTSDDIDRDTRSAFVPTDLAWTGHTQLRVKMLTEIPPGWTYCGDPLNIGNIISWANEWRGENIPEFVLARGDQPAEVRLQFNNKGIRRSYIGTTAQSVGKTEPTMWLDLHTGHGVTDTYKKHIVVHEFGHVLGLTHEHQRSDFWLQVKPYIDVEKMKKDLKVTEKQFKLDWDVDCNNLDGAQTDYDPRSIMHYWFKLSWLTKGYSKKSKIQKDEKDGNLSHQAAKILLGIHNNCSNPVNGPSKLDIHLLSVVYYQQKPDSSDSSSADDIKKETQVNVKSLCISETSDSEAAKNSKVLAFYFESKEVPFEETVTSLKALTESGLSWHLFQHDKRKAKFRINSAFDVTLTSQPNYLELQVTQVGYSELLLPEVCIGVRETIETKLVGLSGGERRLFHLAFKCECTQSLDMHLMQVDDSSVRPTKAKCLFIPLDLELSNESHLVWFAPRFDEFRSQKKGKLILFENDLKFYLYKKNKELVHAEIDEKIKVDYSRALVRRRQVNGNPEERLVRMSLPFPNQSSATQLEEKWSYTITYESGVEHSKTRSKTVGFSAELAPCLEVFGVAGSLGELAVGVEKTDERTTTVSDVKTFQEQFERVVPVPPNSTVIAKHIAVMKKFKCRVDCIGVSLNPKSKVKCTVRKQNETKARPEEKEYELRDFIRHLDNDPIPDKSEIIHRAVSAIYEWEDTNDVIRFDKVEQ